MNNSVFFSERGLMGNLQNRAKSLCLSLEKFTGIVNCCRTNDFLLTLY